MLKLKKLSQISDKTVKSLLDTAVLTDKGMEIPGLSSKEFMNFRNRVKLLATRVKGAIPNDDQNLVNSSMYISSAMLFKNWIPGLLQTRFKKFGKDEFDEFDMGRFSVMFGEFTEKGLLPKLKAFTSLLAEVTLLGAYHQTASDAITQKYYDTYVNEHRLSKDVNDGNYLSFEDFKALREAKLRAMAMELRIFLTLLLMVLGARMLIPDDKDDPIRKSALVAYRMVNRTLLEVSFFLDPRSLSQVATNAIPQIRLMTDVYKLVKNTFKVGSDMITGYEPKKSEKTRRPLYYTSKMFPIVASGVDFVDAFDSYNPDSFWKY